MDSLMASSAMQWWYSAIGAERSDATRRISTLDAALGRLDADVSVCRGHSG